VGGLRPGGSLTGNSVSLATLPVATWDAPNGAVAITIRGDPVMPLGYDKPLYLMAFDHRGSFEQGLFGATEPVSAEVHDKISAATFREF